MNQIEKKIHNTFRWKEKESNNRRVIKYSARINIYVDFIIPVILFLMILCIWIYLKKVKYVTIVILWVLYSHCRWEMRGSLLLTTFGKMYILNGRSIMLFYILLLWNLQRCVNYVISHSCVITI